MHSDGLAVALPTYLALPKADARLGGAMASVDRLWAVPVVGILSASF
jgi:hypothetical protein